MSEKQIEIYVVKGCEGPSLYINDYRVVGNKPWGGGNIKQTWQTTTKELIKSIKNALHLSDDEFMELLKQK